MRNVTDVEDLIMQRIVNGKTQSVMCCDKRTFSQKCRNKGKQNAKEKLKFKQQTQQGKSVKQRPTKTHFVEEDSDDMEDTYTMYQLEDDILITGSSKEEHLNNLETVLGKIQESGMRLNKDKCVFLAPEVVYLGHRIDQYGIYPVESKVKAITEAPEPKNVTELKSYCLTTTTDFCRIYLQI
ncbi:unnamed protein product [Mytilus coruscus]|uniref:Reverse transcriptase domain-containing protein n=1 Tax=Mytilus coruscus TaxID=42192 RepID=A0A6J8BDE7_MYTCO|nr:unnamed protein product [Mytilus coruscus]